MQERCKRICGDGREDCFISNRKQMVCIADMVINKVTGVSAILQILLQSETNPENLRFIERAGMEIQALVDWIRFLEIASDLREFIQACPETRKEERRREPRFPLTDTLQRIIRFEVQVGDEYSSAEIVNISNKGILFKTPHDLKIGEKVLSKLSFNKHPFKERLFYITIAHSSRKDDSFLVGAEIDYGEEESFSIFQSVYEYVEELIFRNLLDND